MRNLLAAFYPKKALPADDDELAALYHDTLSRHRALLLLNNAAGPAL